MTIPEAFSVQSLCLILLKPDRLSLVDFFLAKPRESCFEMIKLEGYISYSWDLAFLQIFLEH